MLGKCVHHVSGIEIKQMVKVDHHNGFDFYKQRKDAETDYTMIYFQHDGHFFPINSNAQRIKDYLDAFPNFDISAFIVEDFEQSLITGARVSKGYAQYLNREQEAQEAVARFKAQKEQEKAEREAREAEEERQRLQEQENAITVAKEEYKQNKRIDSDMFLSLCDRYKVKVPIRTKGWIKDNLSDISCSEDGRVQYSYSGNNKSNSLADIARSLYDVLKDKKGNNIDEELTLDELNHLFGSNVVNMS